MCVSWDTVRLPTAGACSHTNTLPHTAPGTAGAQRWQDAPSAHFMPGTASSSTAWSRAASPQALGGQGRSRAQGWAGSRGVLPGSWELSCTHHQDVPGSPVQWCSMGSSGTCPQPSTSGQRGQGVLLSVNPKHLPAQDILLCLIGTAASAACCSAPKLAQGVAKLALLGVECFLTCCLPHIYIYFKLFQK